MGFGARVLEDLFGNFPQKEVSILKHEYFGPQFTLLLEVGSNSSKSIKDVSLQNVVNKYPEKRSVALSHLLGLLKTGVEKELLSLKFFQNNIIYEYISCAKEKDLHKISSQLYDDSVHILSTKNGAKSVAKLAAYGNAKDMRRIMKSLKGSVREVILNKDAYFVILSIVNVTDDTVGVKKTILDELISYKKEELKEPKTNVSPILELAMNENASKLFLLILAQESPLFNTYFHPFEIEILKPVMIEVNGENVPTSKKDPEQRFKELSDFTRTGLYDLCTTHTKELMRSIPGSKVLAEFYCSFPSEELCLKITEACDEESEEHKLSIFEDVVGHRFVKNLLLMECDEAKGLKKRNYKNVDGFSFASIFYSKFKGRLMLIASSSRGAFVVASLARIRVVKNAVKNELLNDIKPIKVKAKDTKGLEVLLAAIEAE